MRATSTFLRITALLGLALAARAALRRARGRRPPPRRRMAAIDPATAARTAPQPGGDYIRPAGRDAMRDPPRQWDGVDEASDASFAASDPPSCY